MPHDDVRKINDTLRDLSLFDRISALACSIVYEEPRAPLAICLLIEVAIVLTKKLQVGEQMAVRWHLQSAIEELKTTRWN
jgi:hypothetical protein